MKQIWGSFIFYLTKDKETEIKLFKILGLSGILVSVISGIQSISSGISLAGGLINFGAALLSALLMWFVDKTHRYVVGYVITELGVFMALFGMLFFEMGGMSGSMTYFFSFGLVFTFLMFRGVMLIVMEALQVAFYLLIMLFSIKFPESVTPFADLKSQYIDQIVGIIFSGVGIGLIFMAYIFQLEKLQKLAEEASRAKSNFLANMSHELRTPINMMLGINEMIGRESGEESIREYTRKAAVAGNQLMSEVNQLLEFSKIDAGKDNLKISSYNLYDLINSFKDFYAKEANKKGIVFSAHMDDRIVGNMSGDVQKITQILTNLLSNAIKYTQKGSVVLKVQQLELNNDSQLLYFEVSDTGIGIKDSEKKHIFEVFERVDIDNNRSIEGTGLGLAIAQTFALALGGRIEVESKYGEGSRFYLSIEQRLAGNSLENKAPGYCSMRIAPTAKVLVVDDNEMNLEIVKSLLKRTLICVSLANSGEECLDMLEKEHFDLVLLDYMMPIMDGLATLNEIRKRGIANIPVIALTADATEGRRESLIKAGFDGYLTKPVDSVEMENVIFGKLPPNIVKENHNFTENIEKVRFVDSVAKEISLYNIDVYDGLKHFGNNLEQYINVVKIFRRVAGQVLDELEKLYEAKDFEGLTYKIHSLKGNSGNIGATELQNLTAKTEEHLRNGDYSYYEACREFLLFMHNRALDGIEVLIERYDASPASQSDNDEPESAPDTNNANDTKSLLYEALEYIQKGEQAPALRALEAIGGADDTSRIEALAENGDADGTINAALTEIYGADGFKSSIQAIKDDITAIEFDSAEDKLKAILEKM